MHVLATEILIVDLKWATLCALGWRAEKCTPLKTITIMKKQVEIFVFAMSEEH